ncbi:hypothetical protein PV10_02277 [Exophiala mesophila]|uniref:LIM zinc-binding domain-containing protein n=1 Tax=Exophiala mesophila TaxID=212818 RepID=A0A0D1ZIZ1_EXOME|nr:uncharacterized protein PV10_02277 [Exophiala mesophila]KIV94517.1 hypothetical protein PV10_02277 [Exophiala mesophila]
MDIPSRNASFLPGVKCSSCGWDMQLGDVAEHRCQPQAGNTPPTKPPSNVSPIVSQTIPRTASSTTLGLKNVRPQDRPLLPRIDPSVAFRPSFPGEVTPASSGHSSMASPVSATSGPRSPFPTSRKPSIPGPRRPPTPELTNLDCAFPPFPIASKTGTTKRRGRAMTQHSDSNRSKSRDPARNLPPRTASRAIPLTRAYTSDNLPQVGVTAEMRAQASKGSSSIHDSVAVDADSPSPRSDQAAPAHQAGPVSTAKREPTKSVVGNGGLSLFPHVPRPDPGLESFDFSSKSPTDAAAPTNDSTTGSINMPYSQTGGVEPSYRSKRPPPLTSGQQNPSGIASRSPATPLTPSSSVLSRSLGKLFGRRRSQSATSRREVARQALSDEPDDYETDMMNRNVLTPNSDHSFVTSEPSPTTTSPLRSPEPAANVEDALRKLSGHEDSLKALEGVVEVPREAPIVVIEPAAEQRAALTMPKTPTTIVEQAAVTASPEAVAAGPEPHESIHSQRASIDSASSYGSVRFSGHSASSTSSSPPVESASTMSTTSIGFAYSNLLKPADADVPAPLKLRSPGLSADGSEAETDLPFRKGRSSMIVDVGNDNVIKGLTPPSASHAGEVEPQAQGSNSAPEPVAEASSKITTPNKGTCRGCSHIILVTQKSVSSADGQLSGRYHKECFVCWTCKQTFPTAEFYVHSDHPYCAQHYHEMEDSLCATCGKGIEGLYIETANVAGRGKEKHHPECLKCTTCNAQLSHDYFELSGKVYCERDAFRLATMPKSHENAPSRPSPLVREYISSGDPGLVKGRNFPERRITRLMNMT